MDEQGPLYGADPSHHALKIDAVAETADDVDSELDDLGKKKNFKRPEINRKGQ